MDRLRTTRKAHWHRSLYVRTGVESVIATILALSLAPIAAAGVFHATGYSVGAAELCSALVPFVLPAFLYIWLSFIGLGLAEAHRQDVPLPRLTSDQS